VIGEVGQIEIEIVKLVCCKCGWAWIPRKKEVRQCPSCKTAYWDVPKNEKTNLKKEK